MEQSVAHAQERIVALEAEIERLRWAASEAEKILSKWLSHQYSNTEQYVALRFARESLRHGLAPANERKRRETKP